jgi:hypothetical protein
MSDIPEGTLLADGLDDALIGIGYRCSKDPVAVYCISKVTKILIERDGMTEEEAEEFFSFNIGGAWYGEGTPIWMESFPDA